MENQKLQEILKEIPHGHGLSFKKGVSNGLLQEEHYRSTLPNGHNNSYEKGLSFGEFLKNEIAKKVKA